MIAWITIIAFAFALLAWMWLFEHRLAQLLDLAEQLVDRQHGPALAPEVRAEEKPEQPATSPEQPAQPSPQPKTEPMPKTDLVGGARISDQRITDPDEARIFADADNFLHDLRTQYAKEA